VGEEVKIILFPSFVRVVKFLFISISLKTCYLLMKAFYVIVAPMSCKS